MYFLNMPLAHTMQGPVYLSTLFYQLAQLVIVSKEKGKKANSFAHSFCGNLAHLWKNGQGKMSRKENIEQTTS